MDQCSRRLFRDRRKKTTPALSRFTLLGRRRTFRRKIDQQKGGYVDQYDAVTFFFLISAVVLNILDVFTTIVSLDLGGMEVNPIARAAIEVYGDKVWIWKFVTFSTCAVLLCLHSKFRRAKLAIASVNIIYLFAVSFNMDKVFHGVDSYEEVIKLVGKRTVYSRNELINLVSHGPVMIILFFLHFELKNYIRLAKLQKARIILRAPQSVMEISDERYRQILKMGGLDERFTLH